MKKIISFGEIIWDVYGDSPILGGAPLNFAAHASRCGLKSHLFSAVGRDSLGDRALSSIESLGVGGELIQRNGKGTGKCLVTLDKDGNPAFNVITDCAYDEIRVTDRDARLIREISPDALYFGTLIQRSEISRESLARLVSEYDFGEIICDLNLRDNCYCEDSILFCLKHATVIKINDSEQMRLTALGIPAAACKTREAFAKALFAAFPNIKLIIITLGERGCFIKSRDGVCVELAAQKTEVRSTVGAGDSFLAAFVSSYLSGKTLEESAKLGTQLSAYVVSQTEAIPNYRVDGDRILP